jgi:membrane fusion protein, multidrug efflux system
VTLPLRCLMSVSVAIVGCARRDPPPPPPLEVLVVPVVQRDVPVLGEWIGTLDGSVNADIRPKVEGYLMRQF